MKTKKDHPGVYVPPPLFYVAVFFLAIWLQSIIPIDKSIFGTIWIRIIGTTVIAIAVVVLLFRSLLQFFRSGNTVITALPANSLQTTGIYSFTRNPMYLGLMLVYSGIACFLGNWWNFILLPILAMIVQEYIIRREERYLARKFGQEFLDYKKKVPRWI